MVFGLFEAPPFDTRRVGVKRGADVFQIQSAARADYDHPYLWQLRSTSGNVLDT